MNTFRSLFVLVSVLIASCYSNLYSKPVPDHREDISTISEEYVKATRGGVLDLTAVIPGKVYHPRDGYISYERLWCLDEEKGSVDEYRTLMAEVCQLKGGTMTSDWCSDSASKRPLFSATIEQNNTTCTGGDPTTIIHTLEPISSSAASEWRVTAEVFGYQAD
ncbi:hypothetical protein L4D76_24410 [Photobacterium sagamiensis]|uniref:hypothetical protein n=1 Tax=Photobacterium sagamiensis TaxID=2910241 RepID=UPI003D11950D